MANLVLRIGFVAGVAVGAIGSLSQDHSLSVNEVAGAEVVNLDARHSHALVVDATAGADNFTANVTDLNMSVRCGVNVDLEFCAFKDFDGDAIGDSTGGGGSGSVYTSSKSAGEDGATTITTAHPIAAVIGLYINGLKQSNSAFSTSGQTVTVPDTLNVMSGDLLEVAYMAT
jgi:hypothetical protein